MKPGDTILLETNVEVTAVHSDYLTVTLDGYTFFNVSRQVPLRERKMFPCGHCSGFHFYSEDRKVCHRNGSYNASCKTCQKNGNNDTRNGRRRESGYQPCN